MNMWELIEHGECPNEHGNMIYFNHPIDILHILPEELIEPLEGKETPPGMFGYIAAICQECGFQLKVQNIENLEKYLTWLEDYRGLRKTPKEEG